MAHNAWRQAFKIAGAAMVAGFATALGAYEIASKGQGPLSEEPLIISAVTGFVAGVVAGYYEFDRCMHEVAAPFSLPSFDTHTFALPPQGKRAVAVPAWETATVLSLENTGSPREVFTQLRM